jgi:hypothetical protein
MPTLRKRRMIEQGHDGFLCNAPLNTITFYRNRRTVRNAGLNNESRLQPESEAAFLLIPQVPENRVPLESAFAIVIQVGE